jgi:hypothetical protein
LEPIAKGAIGRAFIHGVCPAYINMRGANHRFADVTDGNADHLSSGDIGAAQILWTPGGTGNLWCLVRLGPAPFGINFDVTLSKDGGSDGSNTSAASWTYTAKSRDGSVTYGTGLSPRKPRWVGKWTQATEGVAYINDSRAFVLAEAYEARTITACS